jgi:hypothetical protein
MALNISILLPKLASPAQRAILSTGASSLEELSRMEIKEIKALHGIGRNAIEIITETLKEHGLTLTGSD